MSEAVLKEIRALNQRIDELEDRVLHRAIGVTEVAEILGITAREVRRRAKCGELPTIAGPNKWRFFYNQIIQERDKVLERLQG